MKIGFFLYSATGNTLRVAAPFLEYLENEGHEVKVHDVLDVLAEGLPEMDNFDLVGFGSPVMVFRPPEALTDFFELLPPSTETRNSFLLLTSAGQPSNTAHRIGSILKSKNYDLRFHAHFRCEDSYIPFRKYLKMIISKGKPDEQTMNRAAEAARTMLSMLKAGKRRKTSYSPASIFNLIAKGTPRGGATIFLGKRRLDEQKCTGCLICSRRCPTGAIGPETPPVCDEAKCVGCCACFNNCPENAWLLNNYAPEYYYNPSKP